MDFIEQIFGFAPDKGDGSFEMFVVVAVLAVLGGVIYLRRRFQQK